MTDKIYNNVTEAKDACREYAERVEALMQKYGVWEENDDSCVTTWICAQYLDENGEKRTYCYG